MLTGIQAVIVDLDGTMVDTLGDFSAALNGMLADLQLPAIDPAAIETMVGKGSEHLIRSVLARIVSTPMAMLEGGPLFITFSAGVATQGGYERFADVQDLLRAADDVLYRSKNLGRNRVIARSPGDGAALAPPAEAPSAA